jgi:hypothetical protein
MTKQRVFDSNLLIYYLNASLTQSARQQVDDAIETGAFISVITRIEVLGWHKHSDESNPQQTPKLILYSRPAKINLGLQKPT